MRQLLIADQSGTPLYFDGDNGQLLCPLLMAFQLFVKNNFGESARAVTTFGGRSRVQVALQVRGRLYFVALSDRGESAAELDTELQLAHDLLRATVGPRPFERRKGSVTLWQNKSHHLGFLRLVDTAMALCAQYPSILVHSLERLEINTSIRKICAQSLRAQYASLPEFRAALVFVGTRIFTHYIPGTEFGAFVPLAGSNGGGLYSTPNSASADMGTFLNMFQQQQRSGSEGDNGDGGFIAHDAFMLMLHVQSLFRPAKRKNKVGLGEEEKKEDEEGSNGKEAETKLECNNGNNTNEERGENNNSSSSNSSGDPVAQTLQGMLTASMSMSGRVAGTPRKARSRAVEEVEGVSTDPEGGLLSTGWLPPELRATARTSLFYLASGQAHIVYSAEILPDIYLAVVLRQSNKRLIEQRKALARAHVNYREWLERDYAAFLLTKERAHMPVLSYLPKVPGLVHFLFVDRVHNFAVAPGITPLSGGQDTGPTLSVRQLKTIVYNMVQYAHAHLAYGGTAMVLRANGFQYSYRLCLDSCDSPDVCRVASAAAESGPVQWPLVVSPKLYTDIIRRYRAECCYELYAIYLEFVPVAAVTYKNRQLIKAISAALSIGPYV